MTDNTLLNHNIKQKIYQKMSLKEKIELAKNAKDWNLVEKIFEELDEMYIYSFDDEKQHYIYGHGVIKSKKKLIEKVLFDENFSNNFYDSQDFIDFVDEHLLDCDDEKDKDKYKKFSILYANKREYGGISHDRKLCIEKAIELFGREKLLEELPKYFAKNNLLKLKKLL